MSQNSKAGGRTPNSGRPSDIPTTPNGVRGVYMYPQKMAGTPASGNAPPIQRMQLAPGFIRSERRFLMHTAQAIAPMMSRASDVIKAAQAAQAARIEQANTAVQELKDRLAAQMEMLTQATQIADVLQSTQTALAAQTTPPVQTVSTQSAQLDKVVQTAGAAFIEKAEQAIESTLADKAALAARSSPTVRAAQTAQVVRSGYR